MEQTTMNLKDTIRQVIDCKNCNTEKDIEILIDMVSKLFSLWLVGNFSHEEIDSWDEEIFEETYLVFKKQYKLC